MKSSPSSSFTNERGPRTFMLSFLLRGSPAAVLSRAALLTVLIAAVDWRIEGNIPLGFLYLFPMLLAGSVLSRWQIAIAAAFCTFLTEIFDSFAWSLTGIPRDILIFAAFFCMGLFVFEVVRSRQIALQHTEQIEREIGARSEAEEQLKVLVESSPAAVFTTNSEGVVLLANEAAHRLFVVPAGTLPGRSIHEFLPSLVNVQSPLPSNEKRRPIRTAMQCRGRRQTGEVFLADVWFSTYSTSAGSRLAAMVVDGSEDLRNREELSLHQLLSGSRILVGAVSHEIRNVCGAIAMAHANLSRSSALASSLENNKDFEALGSLILALEKIAAMDLRQMADQASSVDLASLLEEFRIVVEPSLEEKDIRLNDRNRSRHAAGMGGPAEPAPGLFESDEKQRTRNDDGRGRNPPRSRDRSALCEAAGNGALPGYRLRRRSSGPALSSVSAAGTGHRAGIVFVESVYEIVPRRSAV